MKRIVTVMCVYCKKQRDITEEEGRKLTKKHAVPMCVCGGVMVAHSARAEKENE